MIITLCAAGCLLLAAWLWQSAWEFKIDAAPVGSMMLCVSIAFGVASIFLFGVQVGLML